MRTGIVLSIVAMFNLTVAAPALRADVIPTQIDTAEDQAARAQVAHHLVRTGFDVPSALSHAADLPSDAVAHYASSPASLQPVAGLWPEEAVLGLLFVGVLAGIVVVIVRLSQEDS